jgi:hypothetical protein
MNLAKDDDWKDEAVRDCDLADYEKASIGSPSKKSSDLLPDDSPDESGLSDDEFHEEPPARAIIFLNGEAIGFVRINDEDTLLVSALVADSRCP